MSQRGAIVTLLQRNNSVQVISLSLKSNNNNNTHFSVIKLGPDSPKPSLDYRQGRPHFPSQQSCQGKRRGMQLELTASSTYARRRLVPSLGCLSLERQTHKQTVHSRTRGEDMQVGRRNQKTNKQKQNNVKGHQMQHWSS